MYEATHWEIDVSAAENSFSATYNIARQRFVHAAQERGFAHEAVMHPEQDPLLPVAVVDVVRIGPRDASKVLFVTSGVHGTELTAGSGIQLQLIETFADTLPEDFAMVLVHAVNPVGCARLSRTDENNVDPNRNLVASFDDLPENPEYTALHSALCPTKWTDDVPVRDQSLLDYVVENGEKALVQNVLKGQHSHPDGLFFGGTAESWTVSNLTRIVRDHGLGAKQLGVVDLHTGVGPYGFGEVMRMDKPPLVGSEWEKIGNLMCDVLDRVEAERPPLKIIMEFGTYPFDRVLNNLRADNWLRHHGTVHTSQGREIKKDLQDALFADDPKWLVEVSRQGIEVCQQALNEMAQVDEALQRFEQKIAGAASAEAIFQHLEDAAQEHIGVKLFTVMDYVESRNMGRRCYTNSPESYPASGWIALRDNNWFDCVIRNQKTYVANDIDHIIQDFADADLIASLGCGAIVNLPLVQEGHVIATVNLLNSAGYFNNQKLEDAHRFLLPLARMAYFASSKLAQQKPITE